MADGILITPEAILSFPALFEPEAVEEGDEKKYSATLIFTADTIEEEEGRFAALKQAALAAAKERFGDEAAKLLKAGKLKSPFRQGSEKAHLGFPEDGVFITARSKKRPQVVSTVKNPNTGKLIPIEDESEVYPGMIVRAHVGAFAYDYMGNKGVSFGLNGLMKIRDGERLDSYVKAEDAFSADEWATADLSDVQADDFEAEAGDATDDDPLADLL